MTRERVVELAVAELGKSDPAPYWREVLGPAWRGPFPKHWCGAFALWCLHQAGLCDWPWEVSEVNAPKGHYGFLRRLPRTTSPQPGDIGYLDQPFQHHFVVEAAGLHTLTSIDGNQGKPGVQRRHRAMGKSAYYSIAPLLGRDARDTDPAPAPVHPVLRLGSTGADVAMMQSMLNRYQGAGLLVDGAFGPRTARALQTFQRDRGLDADGVCGPLTWAELERVQ